MKQTLEPRCIIQDNAKRIRELHGKVHSTLRGLAYGTCTLAEQQTAASAFKAAYEDLAFPGGFENGVRRIEQGDTATIEYALAFLEVRPYFFRSQYMRKKLIRLLKHASLGARQHERFNRVLQVEKMKKKAR